MAAKSDKSGTTKPASGGAPASGTDAKAAGGKPAPSANAAAGVAEGGSAGEIAAGHSEMSSEDSERLAAAQAKKKKRAKKRHGGHEELNIYSMLDLMTIILVFLIKSWQSDAITLDPNVRPPSSTITEKPSEAIRVFINPGRILLDDKEVAKMTNGDVAADDLDPNEPFLIRGLAAAMRDKAEHFLKIEAAGGAKFEGRYAVVADRRVPWVLLKKVMYTAGHVSVDDETGLPRSFSDARLVTKKAGE